ncbi:MAG TPA: Flp pilus assembly protein CpaB [Candidatus Saccharimonadales bacterium]|nr:Flp pilus assembly protein CpaB [Candidatus Saccharimonadales bacterium]
MTAGLILAACAGVGSFVLISRAQNQGSSTSIPTVSVVVAARTITARTALSADDLAVRSVPIDPTNAEGTFSSPDQLIGRISSITILPGQLITSNLFAFSADSGALAILSPGETMSPNSPDWRAVSISVPDDRAVGGMLTAGEHVDIFVTTSVLVPQAVLDKGQYYGDKSTKVTYQDVPILSKSGAYYVLKVTVQVAEEIAQLQASGTAQFSLALRPDVDARPVDASKMGETTNMIIERYGLPVPQVFPPNNGPIPSQPPIATPTPMPTAVIPATAPSASP